MPSSGEPCGPLPDQDVASPIECDPFDDLPQSVYDAFAPPERIRPSEWIEDHVYLPPTCGEGLIDYSLHPYARAVVDCIFDEDPEEIDILWAAQLGKSLIWQSWLIYWAAVDPQQAIVGTPEGVSLGEVVKTRVVPMLELCPETRALLQPEQKRNLRRIDLRRMVCYTGTSGSPSSLASKSCRVVICTELDKWSVEVSTEADPETLIIARSSAYGSRRLIIRESTPSIVGSSRIEHAYQQSDRRQWHVPCTHCGAYQPLSWQYVRWPRAENGKDCEPQEAFANAWYECSECGKRIEDHHKPAMVRAGRWVRDGESVNRDGQLVGTPSRAGRHAGFHLSSLYHAGTTFGVLAREYLEAVGDDRKLQGFWNNRLSLPFEPTSQKTEESDIIACKRPYPPGVIPERPIAIFLCADAQQDSYYYVTRAWCAGGRSYLLDYGHVYTDQALIDASKKQFECQDGGTHAIRYSFIDSGDGNRTREIYAFCRATGFIPTKGRGTDAHTEIVATANIEGNSLVLFWVSDAAFRDDLYVAIKRTVSGAIAGEFFVHCDISEDYVLQLCSWQRIKVDKPNGVYIYDWKKTRRDDHYWDCEKYQRAIATYFRVMDEQVVPQPQEQQSPQSAPVDGGWIGDKEWF